MNTEIKESTALFFVFWFLQWNIRSQTEIKSNWKRGMNKYILCYIWVWMKLEIILYNILPPNKVHFFDTI